MRFRNTRSGRTAFREQITPGTRRHAVGAMTSATVAKLLAIFHDIRPDAGQWECFCLFAHDSVYN
jgi:hypothetical protein